MQLTKTLSVLALAAIGASALQQPQKQVLISFPQDTPQSELDDYKSAITSAVRFPCYALRCSTDIHSLNTPK